MTCPNCGATLERHAFTHVCSYCGYVSATNEELQYGESEEINNSYYEYISNNLATIKQSPFVDIVQKQDCFECLSSKNFYPNDGHYMLDKKLSFLWHAKVTKQGIRFNLLVKSEHTDAQNYICIKVREDVFTFKQQGEIFNMLAFPMTLDYFLLFCVVDDFDLDTNLYAHAYLNDYQEFVTYTRRFFHIVINKTKYNYSLNIKLLTD